MELLHKYFPELSESQKAQFEALLPLYKEWNEKINVISRKDMENFYLHHVLHSLAIAKQFQFTPGMEVIDLGAGGGFPGLPLAIFFPQTQFTLVDSINKKLNVVRAIAEDLQLNNITAIHSRVEDLKNKKVNAIVCRAVAPLEKLWQWSKPLIAKPADPEDASGLICLKGGDLAQEISVSRTKPHKWDISFFFKEAYFEEKYMLQVR